MFCFDSSALLCPPIALLTWRRRTNPPIRGWEAFYIFFGLYSGCFSFLLLTLRIRHSLVYLRLLVGFSWWCDSIFRARSYVVSTCIVALRNLVYAFGISDMSMFFVTVRTYRFPSLAILRIAAGRFRVLCCAYALKGKYAQFQLTPLCSFVMLIPPKYRPVRAK